MQHYFSAHAATGGRYPTKYMSLQRLKSLPQDEWMIYHA